MMIASRFGWVLVAALAALSAAQQQEPRDQSFMRVYQGLNKHERASGTPGGAMYQTPPPHHKKNTVTHAIKHAAHWVDHHVSAPHGPAYQHRAAKRKHNVNHAVKHTEHWLDHHLSAPHKNSGGG